MILPARLPPADDREQWTFATLLLADHGKDAITDHVAKAYGVCLDAGDIATADLWQRMVTKLDQLIAASEGQAN